MDDTTWRDSLVDPTYGEDYSFSEWFSEWFDGEWVPSARGGFDSSEYSERAIGSCKTCGALVMHEGRFNVEHLNAHRTWHDRLNHVLNSGTN